MKIAIAEEHEATLAAWWALGRRPRTVIYLDAHLDLQHVGESRLAGLLMAGAAGAADDLHRFEKPNALCPDSAGMVGLENWLYPAHRLGLIERLVWVAPPHVAMSARALGQLQQMDGVTPQQLQGFRRAPGGWIEGEPLGLPLRICRLEQLADMALPSDCLVDVDIDYFITVPGDEPWTSPRAVAEALRRLPIEPELLTLCRSVSSGFTPLRYRFLADALAAHWAGDAGQAAHFDRLFDIDAALRQGRAEWAAEQARAEVERLADSAHAWHLLSLAAAEPAERQAASAEAGARCAAYGPDLLREACEARHRQLELQLSSVIGWRARLENSPWDAARRAPVWAALGLLYAAFGHVDDALHCHERCAQAWGPHPELSLAIGRALLQAGDLDPAARMLRHARADDKTCTAALLGLAQALGRAGDLGGALELLAEACDRAPAWAEPWRLRALALQALGRPADAAAAIGQARSLEEGARAVADRLGAA